MTGSVHADACHNQSFFVTGNQGRLEPLCWDVNGYGIHTDAHAPPDFITHPITDVLLADPRWTAPPAVVNSGAAAHRSAARQRTVQ